MSDTIKGFRGKDGPILLDYSGVANVPGAIQSIGDLMAQPGDHFEVETVDGTGRVATVKAVAKPGGGGSGQNMDYTTLTNKPQINGVTLEGNKTAEDLGIPIPTAEQVSAAVQTYLSEHPEATTTVQDGSITPAKFSKPTAERLKFNLYAIGKRIISKEYSKIVLMGDSITDGYGGTGYNGSQTGELSTNTAGYCWANVFKKYIEDKHGVPVENKGMYGTMAAAQAARAKTYLSGGELVIWLTGTNNRISVDSYGDYVSNMGQYISDLQSRCADLVVMSCVPAVESNEKARYVTSAEICEVLVTETAGKAFFVDMRKEFARYCEIFGYTIDSVMADGLHPNNTGYWIMFRLLCDNIGIPISTFVSYKYGSEWWGGHGGDTTEKTLTSISATYSGGSVPVGTDVSALTGIVVTAHYSDGTSETVTGYTLSGTISEGGNNVVVSYGGKTTTFFVTGVTESGSEYVSVFPDHVDECRTPMQEINNFVVSAEIPVGTISKVKISSKIDGVYRLYFATKGGDNAYTVTQVEELNVSIGINTIDTNIEIVQPCYLIVTGEGAQFYFKEGLSDYQPMKSLSYRKNTPVLVGDTFTENSETQNCYIGVWLGMAKS